MSAQSERSGVGGNGGVAGVVVEEPGSTGTHGDVRRFVVNSWANGRASISDLDAFFGDYYADPKLGAEIAAEVACAREALTEGH